MEVVFIIQIQIVLLLIKMNMKMKMKMKILKKNPELNFSSGFINKIKGFVYSIFVNIISVILACLCIVLMYDVLDLDLYFTKDINEYNSYIDINHYNNNNYIN